MKKVDLKKIIQEEYNLLVEEDQNDVGQFSNLIGGLTSQMKQNFSLVEKALALYQQLANSPNQAMKNGVEFTQLQRLMLGLKKSAKQSMMLSSKIDDTVKRL